MSHIPVLLVVLPDFIPKANLGLLYSSSSMSFGNMAWDDSGDWLASLTGLNVGLTFGAGCT